MMKILVICILIRNATIQCLFNLEEFTKNLTALVKKDKKNNKISRYLEKVFKGLKNKKKENLIYYVRKIKKTLEKGIFDNSKQHDCLEFLRYLLNQIEKESITKRRKSANNFANLKSKSIKNLIPKKKKWETLNKKNLINTLFEGIMINGITCLKCNSSKFYFEKFTELSIDLPQKSNKLNLSNLIDNLLMDEIIEDFECEFCKKRNKIKKTHKIIKFPKILTISIKRFRYFPYPKKLNNRIEIDSSDLNLKKFSLPESNSSKYTLSSFIEHRGRYIDFGHYIAFCKDKFDNWIYFNDEKVKNNQGFDHIYNRTFSVYALFYTRS